MEIKELARSAKLKGISIVGTGDFTHPRYLQEIKNDSWFDTETGLLVCDGVFFVPTVEVNNMFVSDDGRKRRVHNLIIMPDLDTVGQFNEEIDRHSRLGADGRPWVRMDLATMTALAYSISKRSLVIPAHIWTPWFSVFGAKAGFDSLKEAFSDQAKRIYAVETGLSSDPAMNHRCSWLDPVSLVSFSDAHSPAKLGREMTIIDMESPSYTELFDAFRYKEKQKILRTVEFFPQEGKYYADGCRKCGIRTTPKETREYKGRCPRCNKKITKGVLGRIDELSDREEGHMPKDCAPYESLVPLQEMISMAIQKGLNTKSTMKIYDSMVKYFGDEYTALHAGSEDIKKMYDKDTGLDLRYIRQVSLALEDMKNSRLDIKPGFDGQFGVVGLKKT